MLSSYKYVFGILFLSQLDKAPLAFLMRDGSINEVQLNDSVNIALTLCGRWLNADGFMAHSLVQATGKLRMVVFPTVCSVSFRQCLD